MASSSTGSSASAGSSAQGSASKGEPASRELLFGLLDRYIDGLLLHDPSGVPFAPDLRATENWAPAKPGEGLWKTLDGITYRQSVADASTGGVAFFGAGTEAGKRILFGIRLKQRGGKIAEAETFVSREGCHPIFSPDLLVAPRPSWDMVLPEEERSPRAKMTEAVDKYFDGIVAGDPYSVPLHPDCNRVENGAQTTNNPPRFPASVHSNMKLLNYIAKIRDRRYPLVDEKRGLVVALVSFDVPGVSDPVGLDRSASAPGALGARSVHIFELFKVESGRIREILAFLNNVPLGANAGWSA